MHPDKVDRARVKLLTDLPNVGPACAKDLLLLGIHTPMALRGKDPLALYWSLSEKTGVRQDPCVLDVFISITRFVNGEPPRPWFPSSTRPCPFSAVSWCALYMNQALA